MDVEPVETKVPKNRLRRRLNAYLGIGISVFCIVVLLNYVEEDKLLVLLTQLDTKYVCIAFLILFLSYILRSWRWGFFFGGERPSFIQCLRPLMIGFFMNNVLPARIGELVRAHVGGRDMQRSRAYVLATIAGERLADGLTISLFFAVMFYLESKSGELQESRELLWVAGLFGLAGIMTAGVLACRKYIFDLLTRMGEFLPGRLSHYTVERMRFFIQGLEPMLCPNRLLLLALLSCLIWGVELLVYGLVCRAFGCSLSLGGLSLFLTAVNFSSLIPAAPGGVGVIEAFATLALVHIGVNRELALAMVAVQHLLQFVVVGIPGTVLFVRMGGRVLEPEVEQNTQGAF